MDSLHGRRALVTGASAGIGRATATALAREGATVLASGRRASELQALKNAYPAGMVETLAGDLDDAGFAGELARAAGAVDIFVNNAGVLTYAPILEITDAECEAMFRTNVLAALRLTQLVARQMVERRQGHIIVITSTGAREVWPIGTIYCATKHALSAITRGLRLDVQQHGIKVTEIAPGMVDTHIRDNSRHPRVLEALKSRKFGPLTPEEVAQAVVYAATATPNLCPDLIELRPKGAAIG
jgi:NADP-dependent 3-hydroxy acid dehydrogenase YdfG